MSKKLLKILSVVCAIALVVCAFAGCSGGGKEEPQTISDTENESSTEDSSGTPVFDKVYKVGISQLVTHDALDAATKGFQDSLKEKLGDYVEFDYQNAANDSTVCATIANQFVADGVDLIMANATPALQAAMSATDEIPIVATSVTDFATALEISDWTGTTGVNVTGTADLAPLEDQAAMVKELLPDAEKVAILYCSGEPNSKYQATVIEGEFDKLGLEYQEFTVADTNEIAAVAAKACDYADCIYIPTDNTIASATAAVNEVAAPENVPIIAGEEGICKGCGIATLSISYYDIGHAAGDMAYDILVNGKDPGQMEIQYSKDLTKEYIADRCETLGVKVPSDYKAIDPSAE